MPNAAAKSGRRPGRVQTGGRPHRPSTEARAAPLTLFSFCAHPLSWPGLGLAIGARMGVANAALWRCEFRSEMRGGAPARRLGARIRPRRALSKRQRKPTLAQPKAKVGSPGKPSEAKPMKGKVLCGSWLSQATRRAGGFGVCLDLHRVCTQKPTFAYESLRSRGGVAGAARPLACSRMLTNVYVC